MLGSAADAEDVVQETWLRWADVDHAVVRDPVGLPGPHRHPSGAQPAAKRARRREKYVGEWLPEPLVTGPDVAADVELAESLSIAMLTVLETFAPTERAVSCCARCSTRRTRRSRRRSPSHRLQSARSPTGLATMSPLGARGCRSARPSSRRRWTGSSPPSEDGDLQGLLDVLAPDVVVVADGGGLVAAARRPIGVRNGWPAC